MKNTIVDKSLNNIIIFVKVLRYGSYEKFLSEKNKQLILVPFHLSSVRHPNISEKSFTKPQQ